MTPVDQEFTHQPDIGQHGDCQRAVLASLLDLPISEVPHFCHVERDGGDDFWTGVAKFCQSKGFVFATMRVDSFCWSSAPVYHGITGPSPRAVGIYHTVVGCNGTIIHDPHPDRTGLDKDRSKWTYDFLVKL